jgi:hypothetical protein
MACRLFCLSSSLIPFESDQDLLRDEVSPVIMVIW